jgi:hypothetical protein
MRFYGMDSVRLPRSYLGAFIALLRHETLKWDSRQNTESHCHKPPHRPV